MVNKYISFIKKSVIFLLIMLIIVSYSFGMTYSNFIYKSDSHRAVEMFTSKLDYQLKINNRETKEYELNPGNNLLHIEIKSLNSIDSYYKLAYKCENININYFNNESNNIIKSNDNIKIDLLVFNKTNKKLTINFEVVGGFVTNKYEDVKVSSSYKEIINNISIGNMITINNNIFRLLNINDDGSYELLSDISGTKLLNGFDGYNHVISYINNLNAPSNSIIYRSVNLSDILKYSKSNIVSYNSVGYYTQVYYPSLWQREDSVINNNINTNILSKEEEEIVDTDSKYASSISVRGIEVNSIEFINKKYEEIFLNSDYLLATRYTKAHDEYAGWGILSIQNKNIKLNELCNSNNNEYEVNDNIRIYTIISNKEDLFNNTL